MATAEQPTPSSETQAQSEPSPLALQLAARVEKLEPPTIPAICAAAVLATVALLEDERSQPGGEWFDDVSAWNGARIRKIMRRGRGANWQRAQEPDGVTVSRDGAEVRAFVPGPLDRAPTPLAKLQIQSTPLDEPERSEELPVPVPVSEPVGSSGGATLTIVLTPEVEMSWGKRAAQCAHAGQWAWMKSDPDQVASWDAAGRPIQIVHATPELWRAINDADPPPPVMIHDGGYTEIPAGTRTAVALWR